MGENRREPTPNFLGYNNVVDPMRMGKGWMTRADDVDISDRDELMRAKGWTRASTNTSILGAYGMRDRSRGYVIDAGTLKVVHRGANGALTLATLKTGLSTAAPYHFEEEAGIVYFANGAEFGTIEPDGYRPWGIAPPAAPIVALASGALPAGAYQVCCTLTDALGMESGNSDVVYVDVPANGRIDMVTPQVAGFTTNVYVTVKNGETLRLLAARAGVDVSYNVGPNALGIELPFWQAKRPRGSIPAFYEGRMCVAEWFPEQDHSIVWRSLELGYHHFVLREGLHVPGQVRMLRAVEARAKGGANALIIGTDREIWSWSEERLDPLASYGVVPGRHAAMLDGDLYFWSLRGLCRAPPFVNLTEHQMSVPPGLTAGAAILEQAGYRRYVVALQSGGEAFNAYQ